MRSHGTGAACYQGGRRAPAQRPPSGICDSCRAARLAIERRYRRTEAGQARDGRYRGTAKGALAAIRSNARRRGSR
jgi:hypothetical protein